MYSEWASLQEEIQCDKGNQSVLHKFPAQVGRDVACSVVRHISGNLSIAAANDEPSSLQDDKDIKWTMEVLCYGLGLPLNEHDTINDCVKVYCEWLTALIVPRPCVPRPIVDDPNPYAQDMLHHLLNLFKPRPAAGVDLVKRQALLCHRVLRAIEGVAKESNILTRATWEALLKFLLAANDSLLSPPTEKDDTGLSSYDIGDHLCERVLSVLFGIWMLACSKCFPSPSLWKTFRNMCQFWRHHEALVIQWHKINHALTSRIIRMMYGPDYPELLVGEEDSQVIPPDTSNECITQSWFRFLHIIQNPVDLCRPNIISNTQRFLQYALASEAVIDPSHHECLLKLPIIFFKAMRGISVMVNAFLGVPQSVKEENLMAAGLIISTALSASPSTPPGQRKTNKPNLPMSVLTGTLTSKGSSKGSQNAIPKTATPPVSSSMGRLSLGSRFPFAPTRPSCNSVLHLFGAWLFDASLAGVKLHAAHATKHKNQRRTSSFIESKHSSTSADPSDTSLTSDNTYEAGRAEACGALCRIFCAHKTREDILPVYYSRFYLIMYYGLQTEEGLISGQVLSNILFNSCDLLRVDLAGVQILVPYILNALELVLTKTQPDFKLCEQIPYVELRKACVHLLLSMLCLPLHFKDLEIKDILSSPETPDHCLSFISLKTRIFDLLQKALFNETDSGNTQMLLGGLMLVVQDLATCEEAEQLTLQPQQDVSDGDVQADMSQTSTSTSSGESSYHDASYHRLQSQPRDLDTAYGLFGHATSLVCTRLMASWKSELNTALAAMELLAGLAKVCIKPPNAMMCKRTVKWICDFIVFQCSRPAPSHSRDLHSMIVAAFKCLQLWLVEHSSLLYDKECLHNVLEVVELGISGSKSQSKSADSLYLKVKVEKDTKSLPATKNRASDPPKFKGDKQLMPASMRVKDAAEAVLTCIIDQVGAFPPPCGPESLFSLLDERSLLKYAKGSALPEHGSPFRYFAIDNSIIIGLLEQPLGNVEDPLPMVTSLIRGPFGRHAWTMQLRHSPRAQKISSQAHLSDPGRPIPNGDVGIHHNVQHRYFPESVDRIPLTLADKSIPPMECLVTDSNKEELDHLKTLIEQQIVFEGDVSNQAKIAREKTPFPDPQTECKPPRISHDYQTARLFLSHYGFLSLEALKEPSNSSVPPALVKLDNSSGGLCADLEALDGVPSRDNDTVHIFYAKPGQKTPQEILSNVTTQSRVQPQFLEFLHSLGWPVDVRRHAGWTGHISTSWRIMETEDFDDDDYQTGTGGSVYDGRQQVLYWADVSSEMAFVVPSPETFKLRLLSVVSDTDKSPTSDRFSMNEPHIQLTKPKSLGLEAEKGGRQDRESPGSPPEAAVASGNQARIRRLGRQPTSMFGPDTKVFAVWLENFEDHENFPTGDLLSVASTGQDQQCSSSSSSVQKVPEKDIFVLFIHALQNGLFRIHLQLQDKGHTKMSMAIPLVDGMLVSRRTLGTLVRQTAINICRRKRLESESYQPPHVRRKLKIQEVVNKYRSSLTEAEFYTTLFQDMPK
ncbi:ral GTPase-activating protein subunit beta-like isoform X1 [Haliotis rufescens]|uniref:ral GTPase-activating protein subunit beta-like isoform X1 n=1 Tax=Haliotis rufescens TaxID=6454 RepID=UPI001EAFE964|nr:ral GTPase-activating protein subunit beta-like isoform X1 [Haliotis rufescens]